jgi:hypothetical protein
VTQDTITSFSQSLFCQNGFSPHNADGTTPRNSDGSFRDNYGGCHQDEAGNWYVLREAVWTINVTKNDAAGLLRFNYAGDATATCETSDPDGRCFSGYVRVYHPDANTWILVANDLPEYWPDENYLNPPLPTPSTLDTGRGWVGAYSLCSNTAGCVFSSSQSVPFKMTVVKP